ncbi:MAG: hypothetical protein ABSG65_03295 [Bryobacteraceae bacterium]|jgi:hypothetical protein
MIAMLEPELETEMEQIRNGEVGFLSSGTFLPHSPKCAHPLNGS